MKAAVLNSIPGQLEIEDISIDSPGPREVLIDTKAAGLCHSDLHFMEGLYPTPAPLCWVTSRQASWPKWVPTCTTSSPETTS